MFLESIAHAVPAAAFTQAECWEIIQRSGELDRLNSRSASLLEAILNGNSGIEKRHLATNEVERIFSLGAEALNQNFEQAAPALSIEALTQALTLANLVPESLDALFICTCTGYLCPGISSYVAQHLGLRPNAFLQDIVGLGCGAAIPTLRSAAGCLAANPEARVACIAVEVCSAAFYLDNDPGVLISACLFGDGASASIWSNESGPKSYRLHHFDTAHHPEHRELLRFTNRGGKLRNQLHRSVPQVAAPIVHKLFQNSKLPSGTQVASHTGGRDVLDTLEATLPIGPLTSARETLRQFGNISSPSVLFALEVMLNQKNAPESIWLTSFGAGFAAHSAELTRHEQL
jgi:predicted naringenin-chalcone synthase